MAPVPGRGPGLQALGAPGRAEGTGRDDDPTGRTPPPRVRTRARVRSSVDRARQHGRRLRASSAGSSSTRRAGREVQASFLNGRVFWESLPGLIDAFWVNIQLFLIAEVLILVLRARAGRPAQPARAGVLPAPAHVATIYVDVFRAIPGLLIIFLLGFGIPALGSSTRATDQRLFGDRRADARLLGVRVRGVPGRHRVDPPEPGGGRALARPVAACRRSASSSCRRPSGA